MAATTYYVSNANIDTSSLGWVLGSDSNNGLSRATPFLTIQKGATSANSAGTGSSVVINKTGGSNLGSPQNEYAEGGSSPGFLNIVNTGGNFNLTISSDASDTSSNYAFVTYGVGGSAGGKIVNIGTNTGTTTFTGLVFDAQGTSSVNAVNPNQSNPVFNSCIWINVAAASYCIGTISTAGSLALTDCNFAASTFLGWHLNSSTCSSVTVSGGVFNCATTCFDGSGGSYNITAWTVQKDVNGVAPVFAPTGTAGYVWRWTGGTCTTFTLTAGTFTGFDRVWYANGSTATTFGTVSITNAALTTANATSQAFTFQRACTCTSFTLNSNTIISNQGLLVCSTDGVTIASVSNNTGTVTTAAGSGPDAILLTSFSGTNSAVSNNIITTAATTHAIQVGPDGPLTWDNNSGASTATQALYDSTSDNQIAFSVTPTAATANLISCTNLYGIAVALKMAGTLTSGTVTCGLYSDSSGPGTLIELSTTTVPYTALTTSAQAFVFQFGSNHSKLTAGTKYWYVFGVTGGTVSASNYFVFNTNATTTLGNISTYSSITTMWTADSSHQAQFVTLTGPYGAITPQVINNSVTGTAAPSAGPHGVLLGLTQGGKVEQCQLYNCMPGIVLKEVWAENTGVGDTLVADNLISSNVSNTQSGCLMVKGYPGAGGATRLYQNTVVVTGASANNGAVTLQIDSLTVGIPVANTTIANPQVPLGIDIKNLIAERSSGAGAGYVYNIAPGSSASINFNNYFAGTNTTISNLAATVSAWQALGYDTNSVNQYPSLTAAVPAQASDFVPLPGSPAIAIGTNLGVYVPTDFFGVAFGQTPTVGAIQSNTPRYLHGVFRTRIDG